MHDLHIYACTTILVNIQSLIINLDTLQRWLRPGSRRWSDFPITLRLSGTLRPSDGARNIKNFTFPVATRTTCHVSGFASLVCTLPQNSQYFGVNLSRLMIVEMMTVSTYCTDWLTFMTMDFLSRRSHLRHRISNTEMFSSKLSTNCWPSMDI